MGHLLTLPAARIPEFGTADEMLLQWAPALAERHARYATRDLAQAKAHLHGLHDSISLEVSDPDSFESYREVLLNMGNLVLTMGCINARNGYQLQFHSGDEYLITIPMHGSGWASTGDVFVEYGQNDIMIVAPSCNVTKHWDGPSEVISLHVPAERFDRAMARLGLDKLQIAPFFSIGNRRLRSFLRAIDMLCRDLQDGDSPFLRNPLAEQLEDMLLTLLLEKLADVSGTTASFNAPKESGGCTSPAIPYYVRRAEQFITANAHCDIGIEDIAQASGVSLRTIQYGFRKYRDMTPMLFLKQLRYRRARTLLTTPNMARRKISDIAAEIGCHNISQFSRDYRALFGESPSDTLAAPRRMVA